MEVLADFEDELKASLDKDADDALLCMLADDGDVAMMVIDWDSEANSEHHAFNYFADKEVLAVPSWTSESESVLEVIHATTDGLSSIGRVHQTALTDAAGDDAWCGSVRRSVIMDDTVWAVSALGLVAADISDPETNTVVVAFDSSGVCDTYYY